jgi:saccharopine dehydrogenase-like NADP-dependent oxidoreductase
MKITVLGAGLVGSAIVRDLAQEMDFDVTAVDARREPLEKLQREAGVRAVQADLRAEGSISALVAGCDLAVCAVPGFMGYETLRRVIRAGVDVVDISFFPEDAFSLDDLAHARRVTAVVDCGVAPGLSNIIAGYVDSQLDAVTRYACYVGGLPQVRRWPYEYMAVFSPSDVLEEYTRPARFVEHGREVVRPALSGVELRDYPGVGTLEAFNTDGLRTLRKTLSAPFMLEKTLRYPGHAELMRIYRESGFFGTTPVELEGQSVRPIALTSKLLFDQWRLKEGEKDLTIMQVSLEGQKGGKGFTYTYDLLDEYDPVTHTTSMARTTGYTCAIVVRQVARGLFGQKGICPPEYIGRTEGCFEDLLIQYAARQIHLQETIIRDE